MDREVVSENAKVDHKIYLSFQFENLARQDLFKPGSYRNFLGKWSFLMIFLVILIFMMVFVMMLT